MLVRVAFISGPNVYDDDDDVCGGVLTLDNEQPREIVRYDRLCLAQRFREQKPPPYQDSSSSTPSHDCGIPRHMGSSQQSFRIP